VEKETPEYAMMDNVKNPAPFESIVSYTVFL
jgi:hypothetical protein